MASKKKFNFAAIEQAMEQKESSNEQEKKIVEATTDNIPNSENEKTTKVASLLEKIDTPINTAFEFKFIPRNKMIFSQKNDYPMESVKELADQILDLGLINNIEVMYDLENDTYIIDSGEQRTRAIDLLIDTYKEYEDKESTSYKNYLKNVNPFHHNGYPCNVRRQSDNPELDELNTEIRLIIANESGRKHDSQRTQEHVQRLKELYDKRNLLAGKAEKINVNEEIGKMLNISDRQVKKYNSLEKLIPEFKEMFRAKKLTLTDGSNYSNLNEDEQRQILHLIENGESKQEITNLSKQLTKMKSEIEEKERNLKLIEQEKENAKKLVAKTEQQMASLREDIKKELLEDDPNKQKIESLNEKLEAATNLIQTQNENIKEAEAKQSKKIEELQNKLKKQEQNKKMDIEQIKAENTIENTIVSIQNNVKILVSTFKNIQNVNTEQIEEISKIINKLESIRNKCE